MKIKMLVLSLIVCASCLFAIQASAGGDMNGEWQISTTIMMPGMPMAISGGSFTHCMDGSGVPHQESPDQDCKTLSRKVSGDTVSWHMSCAGPDGDVEMKGSSTYSGDSMNGSISMITGRGSMTMQMQGRKLGACR